MKKMVLMLVILLGISFLLILETPRQKVNSINKYEKLEGFYSRNTNKSSIDKYKYDREPNGDWVCVNIRNMTYQRALKVIKHEVGHEIFAEICENNIDKCFKVADEV